MRIEGLLRGMTLRAERDDYFGARSIYSSTFRSSTVSGTPPLPIGQFGKTMAAGFEKLGWHWWISDGAIVSQAYAGRPGCNLCGPCDLGCPTGARGWLCHYFIRIKYCKFGILRSSLRLDTTRRKKSKPFS